MTAPQRTEEDVLRDLSPTDLAFLKRVLQIEQARRHISGTDATICVEDILQAVEEALP